MDFYRDLFANGHVVMLVIDPGSGEIVDANPAAERFYGWTRDELRSMRITEINTLTPDAIAAEMERARLEQRTHFLFPHRVADGSIRHVEVHSGPVRSEGRSLLYSVILDVTERSERERALADEAIRRRVLFENLADGIGVTDAGFRLVEVNPALAAMLGVTPAEALGMHVREWGADPPPDGAFRAGFPGVPGGVSVSETRWTRADGTVVDVEVHSSAVEWRGMAGRLHVCRDVTARKRAEAASARWRTVFERADFGVARVDMASLTFIEVNGSYARERGYEAAELAGRPVLSVYPSERHDAVRGFVNRLRESGHMSLESEHVRKDGSRFPVLVEATYLVEPPNGRETSITYNIDISDRVAAEESLRAFNASLQQIVEERTAELRTANEELLLATRELRRSNDELMALNVELREVSETRSAFLRSMSHELRTPLNSIIGFSRILLTGMAGPTTDEQVRQLEMINHSGRHLLEIVNDILDLSRVDAGKVEVAAEPFDLAELACEVLGVVRPIADEKGLSLRLDEPDGPLEVVSDRVKVRQILLNLAGNAVKFTGEGSVTIVVGRSAPGMVAVAVVDTGPGIPPEDQDGVFGEFAQVSKRRHPEVEGSGLGLAICRALAALLGGAVTLSSEVGSGSTFRLLLPERYAGG